MGFKGGRCKIKEVSEEVTVSVETEEETEELGFVELEDEGSGGPRMETKVLRYIITRVY